MRVFAPASIANLGAGFDVLGLALEEPGDIVSVKESSEPGVRIKRIGGVQAKRLPMDPEKNCVTIAAENVLKRAGVDIGLIFELEKGIRHSSGLGSSAASAACGAFAAMRCLKLNLTDNELVSSALISEMVVSGKHVDNLSASLLGGLTIVRMITPVDVLRLEVPPIEMAICTPNFELHTEVGRSVLPKEVNLNHAIRNMANSCAIIWGMVKNDIKTIGKGTTDHIVERYRAPLIPGYFEVRQSTMDAGALGFGICGAGPSLFAIGEEPQNLANVMRGAFEDEGIEAQAMVARCSNKGAREI